MSETSTLENLIEKCWLPGRENLARHVPSLNTLAGKVGWLLAFYAGPGISLVVVYLIESQRPDLYLWTQGVMVIGAFILVDGIGIWGRDILMKVLGERAYAFSFSFLFVPGLMFGFLPGVMHIFTVPGTRLLPLGPALVLAAPFLLIGLLIAFKVYFTFGLDRFIYMYMYYPDEGTMVTDQLSQWIRHPQYSSFFFLCDGLVIAAGSLEAFYMTLFIALFGIFRVIPEEIELGQRFGESYKSYRRRVPGVVPYPKNWRPFLKYLLTPGIEK